VRSPRVIKLAPGGKRSAWARALADPTWRDAATLLKRDKDTTVWRTHMLGNDVVIKCWSLERTKRRLQAITRTTPACRQWRGALRLLKVEIATSKPYALARLIRDGQREEVLVMQAVQGKSVLEHLAIGDLSAKQEHAVAAALGDQIRTLLVNGMYNRDHKPSNLIVEDAAKTSARIAIIDTVSINSCGVECDLDFMCDMLFALLIEPIGCKCAPRKSLRLRTMLHAFADDDQSRVPDLSREALKKTWHDLEDWIKLHGDPTPKVDPLANVRRKDG
jgi:tRNA A-37 threonylcarbamoyl transferase component Bud32